MTAEATLVFGSRSGTWIALALLGSVFALLAIAVLRALPPRSDAAARRRRGALATIVVAGMLATVYVSSFRGFHELMVLDDGLRLRYLLPFEVEDLGASDVAQIRPAPWYRGQWRLAVTTVDGRTFESAPSARDVVRAAADRVNARWRRARPAATAQDRPTRRSSAANRG